MTTNTTQSEGGRAALRKVLKEARERIQVADGELDEARRRRKLLTDALRREFTGCRVYLNGSIAHGDALTPLTDIDLGVVIPNPDNEYGPDANGPAKLQERAAQAIRYALQDEFPGLRVIVGGRKRSVYVAFGAPVDPDVEDFSADVIVAVDHLSGAGLWIPNYDTWDRSHPEEHTRLVKAANRSSNYNYAKTVRLLKHWARRHSKPLCSWNVKALALTSLAAEADQLDGMAAWFDHAIAELGRRQTPDPAGIAGPINLPIDRQELVAKLVKARAQLAEAADYADNGYDVLAVDALAVFFNDQDMLVRPAESAVSAQRLQRAADTRNTRTVRAAPAAAVQVRGRTPVRSWAP